MLTKENRIKYFEDEIDKLFVKYIDDGIKAFDEVSGNTYNIIKISDFKHPGEYIPQSNANAKRMRSKNN